MIVLKKLNIWMRLLIFGLALIVILSGIYFFLGKKDLTNIKYEETYANVNTTQDLGELTDSSVVTQSFTLNANVIDGINVKFATYGHIPEGKVTVNFQTDTGDVLKSVDINAKDIKDNEIYYFDFEKSLKVNKGEIYYLVFNFSGSTSTKAATLWAGEKQEGCTLTRNGEELDYTLYMDPVEMKDGHYVQWFFGAISVLIVVFVIFVFVQYGNEKKGKKTPAVEMVHIFDKYNFLLKQLVARDFKNKYRRSYLGVLWSLLNPLLMMVIVSAVFSFVFRYSIEHFQVYLILGQVTFNVFSEATQIALTTIVGSSDLIKKVYLPKYIFPLSKTMFSFVNFAISFIAVVGVLIFYKIPFNTSMLYLPLLILFLFMFSYGVGLLLSAMMVFLRDIQHLYGIVIMAWSYLTPIFYPVDSLAPFMQKIMNFNPMYHYLTYMRTIMMYGTAPSVQETIICFGMGLAAMIIGSHYFFKKQNRFILYI